MNQRPPTQRFRRAGSLGQVDSEFDHGPRPLNESDVPIDLRKRLIQSPGGVPGSVGGPPGLLPNGGQDLTELIKDVHSIAGTLVLRRGLLGRVVSVPNTPTLIINQTEVGGRGYLLLNPAGVVGLTAKGTLISSQVLAGATTLQSGNLGVANYKTAKLFVGITFSVGAGPVTIDIQTLDPVTGLWFISQTLSLIATGNIYTDLGTLGVDTDLSVLITVPGGTTVTLTVGFVLKDGLDGTSAGVTQTIFIGQSGVSPTAGYPILSGKEKSFYILENVQIYAVTAGPTLNMNIFEL
jgi:hypothetical protein